MQVKRVIETLKRTYPGKYIVLNPRDNPTEIICEVEPASEHQDYSKAIAVIDLSLPHFHKITTEVYNVIKGALILTTNDEQITLNEGDSFEIKPDIIHSAKGNETWVEVISRPGWTFEDHIVV